MPRSIGRFSTAALATSLMLLPVATFAFNPQPDPPGKTKQQSKSLSGPDTKAFKRGQGSWKQFHDVEEKSKSKGGK